jgi:hypothetical protein
MRPRDVAPKQADPTGDLLEPAAVVGTPLRDDTPIPVDRVEDTGSETISVSLATVMSTSSISA